MRRIQISARGGGECALPSVLEKTCGSVAVGMESATASSAGMALTFCGRPDLANGCPGGAVRSTDVAQQAMFAQHRGLHAFSLGALVMIQLAAGSRTVAAPRASPTVKHTMVLLSIGLFVADSESRVEWRSARDYPRNKMTRVSSRDGPRVSRVAYFTFTIPGGFQVPSPGGRMEGGSVFG